MKYLLTGVLLAAVITVFGQTNISNDTLHWNSQKQLTWGDFKGEPIEGVGLIGEVFCMNVANFEKPGPFQKTKFKVVAIFDRTKAWINESSKSDKVLTYFQVTFNIYEVHARSLRRDLSTAKVGSDPTPIFQAMYNQSMTNLMNEFNLFRKETKLGLDIVSLDTWKVKVDEELKGLDEYKR